MSEDQLSAPAAAEASQPPAEAPVPDEQVTPARRRRWRDPVVLTLAVLVAGAAAVTGVLAYRVALDDQSRTARAEALDAANSHAPVILSYDYRSLEEGFAAAEDLLTGDFKASYAETTSSVVAPSAKQYKAVVEANVVAAAVVSATPQRVVTLLFVNQATTSTRIEGTKLDLNRVVMTLEKVGDRWLVSDVDAL